MTPQHDPQDGCMIEDMARRYARHSSLPEFGCDGVAKLRAASILVVGAGGLGSPLLLYLAAAGVGKITVIDDDRVDLSNLQRQIIFDGDSLGLAKVAAARERLLRLNPTIEVTAIESVLTKDNATELIGSVDLVVDGSDNFACRYLVNRVCFELRKTLVSAAVTGFAGQLTVIAADGKTRPCYNCLFPSNDSASDPFATCDGLGVLGPAAGVMGSLQAVEVIKAILGIGESMIGRLLVYEALSPSLQEFHYRIEPSCAVCGGHPDSGLG
ncbi:MAG: HesA/MoeB/ThiF family protein [Alphaproteobacteria bacterium]|nr:HesA/MoeB/ThiF family protein [Alphaproteobacteria bacterium]